MNSLSKEIIENLNNRLLQQTVIINTLCDIIVENNLISDDELTNRINSNMTEVNEQLENLYKSEEKNLDDELYSSFLSSYGGPIGEA